MINECHVIRVIAMPLIKRPGTVTTQEIELLNICVSKQIPQQRPVIEIVTNEKKEFCEFEVIRIFDNEAEAKFMQIKMV
ncbi:MAG: hypothetical protein H0W73_20635 [Bacteroidetes bacterium]|nr:hypothetical protein [Bacteroidota bacterium]